MESGTRARRRGAIVAFTPFAAESTSSHLAAPKYVGSFVGYTEYELASCSG